MGKIPCQVKSEIRQLPFMIGKVVGGILAVIGFTAAVVTVTRRADPSFADILPSALVGFLGIIIFVLSSMLLTRRFAEDPAGNPVPDDRTRSGMLPWAILLLLAALFIFFTYLIAG